MKKRLLKRIGKVTIFSILFTALFPYGAGIANAAEFTSAKLALGRVEASIQTTHTWTIQMPADVTFDGDTTDDELVIDYPVGAATFAASGWVVGDFTLSSSAEGSISVGAVTAAAGSFTYPACSTYAAVAAVDTTALKIGILRCTGAGTAADTFTLAIASRITNGTAGTKIIAVNHDEDCGGSCGGSTADNTINAAIDLITDDQIGASATVNPTLDFQISVETDEATCKTGTIAGSQGTITMGSLSSSSVGRFGYICTVLDTNATDGASVYVKSLNGSLKSTSDNSDIIPNTAYTTTPTELTSISNTAEKYGLCISSTATNGSGVGTSGAGATPAKDAVYDGDGTCTTAAGTSVGQLSTTAGQIWSVTGPTVDAFANLLVFAAVTTTTEAHTDYSDTLTFTVASTF